MRSSTNIIQPGLTQTHSAYTQQCAAWGGGLAVATCVRSKRVLSRCHETTKGKHCQFNPWAATAYRAHQRFDSRGMVDQIGA